MDTWTPACKPSSKVDWRLYTTLKKMLSTDWILWRLQLSQNDNNETNGPKSSTTFHRVRQMAAPGVKLFLRLQTCLWWRELRYRSADICTQDVFASTRRLCIIDQHLYRIRDMRSFSSGRPFVRLHCCKTDVKRFTFIICGTFVLLFIFSFCQRSYCFFKSSN